MEERERERSSGPGWRRVAAATGLLGADGAPGQTVFAEMTALARATGAVNLGQGFPDEDGPPELLEAAVAAMRRGQTKYTEVAGIPELRAAVCDKLQRDNGLAYEPAEVLVSCGAKHTLFNIATALVNPGDEVLVPSPFWVSYPEQVRLLGGEPVAVPTDEATGFDLDPDRLRADWEQEEESSVAAAAALRARAGRGDRKCHSRARQDPAHVWRLRGQSPHRSSGVASSMSMMGMSSRTG